MAVNWRPDLFGKPTIQHLIRAGLLQPATDLYGNEGGAGIDPQGRLVTENPQTRELFTNGMPNEAGGIDGTPYDPIKELGVTALQQAGFLAEDQYNAANYRPSEESGTLGTWWEGMKEGGIPMLAVMAAGTNGFGLMGGAGEIAPMTMGGELGTSAAELAIPGAAAGTAGAGTTSLSALEQELSQQVLAQQGASLATGGAAGTGITTAGAATGATALSSLKNILDNGGSVDDWLSIAGKAVPGLIGAYAANDQADAISGLGDKEDARIREFMTYGAPSRERYEASFAPGFDITSDPALRGAMDTTTDTLLRRLSTQGNPYGSPGGLAEAEKYVMENVALPYVQSYRNQNASTGGYGAFNTTAASGGNSNNLNLAGINADAGMWGGLGDAASSVFTPKTSLEQLLKQLKGYGVGTSPL